MASACGIHVDRRRWSLVVLEGGARRHKLVAHASGELPEGTEDSSALADVLKRAVKEHKVRADSVGLALDSGRAAFRTLTLPFDDRAKIEEVLKYEVENDLPQWDVEDVVVDFLVLSSKPGVESHLLVTAIPKQRLVPALAACERAGLEASEAELDGTALFNAAHAAGFLEDEAAQILVHVGDASTTVVVVDGGRLASMRSIRAGALPPRRLDDEGGAEGEAAAAGAGEIELENEVVEEGVEGARRREETARRIRRELGRTLSAARTVHPVAAIYVCGHELPGLSEETLFDVPIQPLRAVPGAGGEGGGEGEASVQALVIAYGAALRELGAGILRPRLRREDLRFTGRFERLELPLAVFALLLCTFLAVRFIVISRQIDWRDEGDLTKNSAGDMQLWLQSSNAYLLPDPESGRPGRLKSPPPDLVDYARKAELGQDAARTKYQELLFLRGRLAQEVEELKRQLGQVSDIKQPQSALKAATLVLSRMDELGERIGRFAIRRLEAQYQPGRARRPDAVAVTLDADFFGDTTVEASRHYNALQRALQEEPWVREFEERPTRPFADQGNGAGIAVEGLRVLVDVEAATPEADA